MVTPQSGCCLNPLLIHVETPQITRARHEELASVQRRLLNNPIPSMLVCMDGSQIISSVAGSQQEYLSPLSPEKEGAHGAGSPAWASPGYPVIFGVAVRARTRQQRCPQPWQRNEHHHRGTSGTDMCPSSITSFLQGQQEGEEQNPPGLPPSQGSD